MLGVLYGEDIIIDTPAKHAGIAYNMRLDAAICLVCKHIILSSHICIHTRKVHGIIVTNAQMAEMHSIWKLIDEYPDMAQFQRLYTSEDAKEASL